MRILLAEVKAPGFDGDIQYAKRLSAIINMSQILDLSTLFGKESETLYACSVHNANGRLKYDRFYHLNRLDTVAGLSRAEGEYLLNVGRLSPQKNQQALIRVFSKVAREFPKLKLVIVGEGEERKSLYYRGARLFVLTSRHEGFGNVF